MAAPARIWTREEVLVLPDDGLRHEMVDGRLLVSPSPRPQHQRAVLLLYDRLAGYVRSHRVGEIMALPADLDLGSGQLIQPDLFVTAMAPGHEPLTWEEYRIPLLVVEVLSDGTARHDRVTKRRLYQRAGVPVYWIVDLDARVVEVWTPRADRPDVVETVLAWQPVPPVSAWTLDLESWFRSVRGDG